MLVFPAPDGAVMIISFPSIGLNKVQIKETNASYTDGFQKTVWHSAVQKRIHVMKEKF